MPPVRRPKGKKAQAVDPFPADGLTEIGLAPGTAVRFRRRDTERWKDGTVTRREADGSIGVSDSKGAMRAMPIDAVEVKERGPRGGVMWIPLSAWAGRTEQLKLL
jgi:hypothetical protein